MRSTALQLLRRAALTACGLLLVCSFLQAQEQKGLLTVKRIYSQPSLSGKLNRGVQWTPDGKTVSFLDPNGQGKEEKNELWGLDVATGQRRVLIGAEKMTTVLPAEKTKQSQATGLGRRAASQYQWAPNGEAILFIGSKALGWFELKTQAARTLVDGKDVIADAKISPDGKCVSFVREHNLFVVSA